VRAPVPAPCPSSVGAWFAGWLCPPWRACPSTRRVRPARGKGSNRGPGGTPRARCRAPKWASRLGFLAAMQRRARRALPLRSTPTAVRAALRPPAAAAAAQASSAGTSSTPPPAKSTASPCCRATRSGRGRSRQAHLVPRCPPSEPKTGLKPGRKRAVPASAAHAAGQMSILGRRGGFSHVGPAVQGVALFHGQHAAARTAAAVAPPRSLNARRGPPPPLLAYGLPK
jgi:hypothetical protein